MTTSAGNPSIRKPAWGASPFWPAERWLGKFGQQDKWTFCLTTAQDAESRREYEQTMPPET
jgi:hypothetical protein